MQSFFSLFENYVTYLFPFYTDIGFFSQATKQIIIAPKFETRRNKREKDKAISAGRFSLWKRLIKATSLIPIPQIVKGIKEKRLANEMNKLIFKKSIGIPTD